MIRPLIKQSLESLVVEVPRTPSFKDAMSRIFTVNPVKIGGQTETYNLPVRAHMVVKMVMAEFWDQSLVLDQVVGVSFTPLASWVARYNVWKVQWDFINRDLWTDEDDTSFRDDTFRFSDTLDLLISTPYSILFVTPNAPQEVIDAAHRALVKMYHEGSSSGKANPEKWKQVNTAYSELKSKQ